MSTPRIRYPEGEEPVLVYRSPECGSCYVGCDHDGDGWVCPVCGTSWGNDDYDEKGDAYAEWSGEDVDHIPFVSEVRDGMYHGIAYEREQRDATLARIRNRGLE